MQAKLLRLAITLVATVALVFAGASAPASAKSDRVRDPDGSGPLNIRASKIAHKKRVIVANVKVANLKKKKAHAAIFRFQTRPKKRRIGLIVRAPRKTRYIYGIYTSSGLKKLKCKKLRVSANFRKDRIKAKIPRKCMGKPRKVRMNVKTGKLKSFKGSGRLKDRARWTNFVRRG